VRLKAGGWIDERASRVEAADVDELLCSRDYFRGFAGGSYPVSGFAEPFANARA